MRFDMKLVQTEKTSRRGLRVVHIFLFNSPNSASALRRIIDALTIPHPLVSVSNRLENLVSYSGENAREPVLLGMQRVKSDNSRQDIF